MSSIIGNLFSQSPFSGLEEMMKEINFMVLQIPKLFSLVENYDEKELEELFKLISSYEYKIDNIKKDIRKSISKTIFLPIPKRDFIDLILTMDGIPDSIELLSKLFLLKRLTYPSSLSQKVLPTLELMKEINKNLSDIIFNEFPSLMASSFSHIDSDSIIQMIDEISSKTYDLENLIHKALKEVFVCEDILGSSEVLLWVRILRKLESVGHYQEKTANILRRIIEE